jgi:hypothetical protein
MRYVVAATSGRLLALFPLACFVNLPRFFLLFGEVCFGKHICSFLSNLAPIRERHYQEQQQQQQQQKNCRG